MWFSVIVNDYGDPLWHTARGTHSEVEEYANEFFGKDLWRTLQEKGAIISRMNATFDY